MAFLLRRGWWKPWNWSTRTWLLAIIVSTLLSPFVTRWICLWQVPDVALPFAMSDVIGIDVPKEQDAFTQYLSVIQTLSQTTTSWLDEVVDQVTRPLETKWDDRLDQWLLDNASLLAEFERASQMERAQWISLKALHVYVLCTTHQNLRKLAKIAQAEALRCERFGDLAQAWKWHRAVLRCSGHAEKPGFGIAYGIGRAIRINAYAAISRWAEHPSLTTEELRSARNELSIAATNRMALSDIVKIEYLMIKNTLDQDYAPNFLYPKWGTASRYEPQLLMGKRLYLWTIGQPEISLRLCRQLLLNNLDQLDQPLHRRQKVLRSEYPMVFEHAPGRRRAWGQLDGAQLVRAIESQLGQHLTQIELFTDLGPQKSNPLDWDKARRLDDAHVSMIDTVLAAHEFQRIHDEFPATIQQLIPKFLDAVPFDPMSDTGAPLNYRRNASGDALIWSIGINGTDDGGDLEGKEPKDAGYRIHLTNEADPQRQETNLEPVHRDAEASR